MDDIFFMRRAIELARNGEGFVSPNPLVGAVIVKEGKILAEGFHRKYGELHAEREALKSLCEKGLSAQDSTLFVTLEPCCHEGKQPPCVQTIFQAGIKKVVVGSRDPNPLVHGKGNAFLREQGIEVQEDFLKEECDALNPIFFHYITEKTPYVALKYAMTLDGKISTQSGKSKWITNEKSRLHVHALRKKFSAILCGIDTVLKDDPMLDSRCENPKNPLRIVCDSSLRLPLESRLVQTSKNIPVVAVCVKNEEKSFLQRKNSLLESGVEVLELSPDSENRPDVRELVKILGERGIDSLLVEGGGEVNFSFLQAGLVNRIYAFLGSKIFGGRGKSPVSGKGVENVEDGFFFTLQNVTNFDGDVLLEYEAKK